MKVFGVVSLAGSMLLSVGSARGMAQEEIKLAALQQPSQQGAQQSTQQPAATPAPDKSKIVYVSDFELDAVDANGKLQKGVPAIPTLTTPRIDPRQEPSPVERAGRLVDFMSKALIKELQKAGFPTHRLRPGDARPLD